MPAAALLLQAAALPVVRGAAPEAGAAKEETFDGLWLDIFEGQQFIPGARVLPARIAWKNLPALTIDRTTALRALPFAALAHERIANPYSPHGYRISFVGSRDPIRDCRSLVPPQWGCIGIGGVMPYSLTVARVLSIEDAGPLPQ